MPYRVPLWVHRLIDSSHNNQGPQNQDGSHRLSQLQRIDHSASGRVHNSSIERDTTLLGPPNVGPRTTSFTGTTAQVWPRVSGRGKTQPHVQPERPNPHAENTSLILSHEQVYREAVQSLPAVSRLNLPVLMIEELRNGQIHPVPEPSIISRFDREPQLLIHTNSWAWNRHRRDAIDLGRTDPYLCLEPLAPLPEPTWFEGNPSETQCPVCYEQIAGLKFRCHHGLCQFCFDKMLAVRQTNDPAKCPMCRAVIHDLEMTTVYWQ